jgi:hypothetical protein
MFKKRLLSKYCLFSQMVPPGFGWALKDAFALVDAGNAVASGRQRMGPFFRRQFHAGVDHLGYHFPVCKPSLFLKLMMHLIFKPLIFIRIEKYYFLMS